MKRQARQLRRRHFRHGLLRISLLLATVVMLGRAAQLQVLQGESWRTAAMRQHEKRVVLPAPRGAIYDKEGQELVVSRTTYRLSVAPHELVDREAATRSLRQTVGLGGRQARAIVEGDDRWIDIPGRFSALEKERLEKLIPRGFYSEPEVHRFYPRGSLAAEIVGRVDYAGRGQSGLELAFDSLLTGQPGFGVRQRDATGASAGWLTTTMVPPSPGAEIHLTIDAELQALTESVLEDAIRESDASGGDLLIIEPKTGDLLAAASRRRGRRLPVLTAATEPYEAGSTLKPFTAAALLAAGLAELSDSVDTGRGLYRTAGRTIHDVTPHGRVSLAQTLAVSSNVGMAMFAERLPKHIQYGYLRNFGFGTPTGITYPSESPGILRRPDDWSAQSGASLAIGYEVAVTPLQLVVAYGALANGGLLMRPQLVREARNPDGTIRWEAGVEVIRRTVREDVAALLREVLASAVTQGTGQSAGVRGLSVAGKTGTAWRYSSRSGYADRTYTSSFVGLIPSDDPQLVILVKLDEPSGAYYGGLTAAPVMRTAVRAALAGSYWSAPPLMGEPEYPYEQAGVPAGQVPAGGPFVFALDAPLMRAVEVEGREPESAPLPDVTGLSLRAAAHRLHDGGWRVIVRGGGRVVSMQPTEGARVRRGGRVVLRGEERGPPAAAEGGKGVG